MKLEVVKDFSAFITTIDTSDYNEVYELYQIAKGEDTSETYFTRQKANGSDDILIICLYNQNALRLSKKAAEYFPEWIEDNLMDGLDGESFWAMKHAEEKDQD